MCVGADIGIQPTIERGWMEGWMPPPTPPQVADGLITRLLAFDSMGSFDRLDCTM
jgi:hypothetical protein